jgi:hypothetical protein
VSLTIETKREAFQCRYKANIIGIIMSQRMTWTGHVTGVERRNAYRILVGKPDGKRH